MKSIGKEPKSDDKDTDYEADSAVEALIRAEEIKGNKGLMERVQKKLAKKYRAVQSLQDLKDMAAEMDEDDS